MNIYKDLYKICTKDNSKIKRHIAETMSKSLTKGLLSSMTLMSKKILDKS